MTEHALSAIEVDGEVWDVVGRPVKPWTHIEGVPKREWFATVSEVKGNRSAAGLSPVFRPRCQGGYCKRHRYSHPIKYETADGLVLCDDCSVIWAARCKLGLKHGIDDL